MLWTSPTSLTAGAPLCPRRPRWAGARLSHDNIGHIDDDDDDHNNYDDDYNDYNDDEDEADLAEAMMLQIDWFGARNSKKGLKCILMPDALITMLHGGLHTPTSCDDDYFDDDRRMCL